MRNSERIIPYIHINLMELSIPLHITGVRGEKEKKKNQDTGTGFNSIFSISSQDGGSRSSTMGSITFF